MAAQWVFFWICADENWCKKGSHKRIEAKWIKEKINGIWNRTQLQSSISPGSYFVWRQNSQRIFKPWNVNRSTDLKLFQWRNFLKNFFQKSAKKHFNHNNFGYGSRRQEIFESGQKYHNRIVERWRLHHLYLLPDILPLQIHHRTIDWTQIG